MTQTGTLTLGQAVFVPGARITGDARWRAARRSPGAVMRPPSSTTRR